MALILCSFQIIKWTSLTLDRHVFVPVCGCSIYDISSKYLSSRVDLEKRFRLSSCVVIANGGRKHDKSVCRHHRGWLGKWGSEAGVRMSWMCGGVRAQDLYLERCWSENVTWKKESMWHREDNTEIKVCILGGVNAWVCGGVSAYMCGVMVLYRCGTVSDWFCGGVVVLTNKSDG